MGFVSPGLLAGWYAVGVVCAGVVDVVVACTGVFAAAVAEGEGVTGGTVPEGGEIVGVPEVCGIGAPPVVSVGAA